MEKGKFLYRLSAGGVMKKGYPGRPNREIRAQQSCIRQEDKCFGPQLLGRLQLLPWLPLLPSAEPPNPNAPSQVTQIPETTRCLKKSFEGSGRRIESENCNPKLHKTADFQII